MQIYNKFSQLTILFIFFVIFLHKSHINSANLSLFDSWHESCYITKWRAYFSDFSLALGQRRNVLPMGAGCSTKTSIKWQIIAKKLNLLSGERLRLLAITILRYGAKTNAVLGLAGTSMVTEIANMDGRLTTSLPFPWEGTTHYPTFARSSGRTTPPDKTTDCVARLLPAATIT